MDIRQIRDYFPFIKKGKIYFNHASSGPLPLPAAERIKEFIRDRSEDRIEDYSEFIRVMGDTKSQVAKMLNTQPSRIAFLDNTSNGLNLLAQSLDWKRGDHILLNDIEFPANVYPFLNLRRRGVEVDFVKSNRNAVSSSDIIRAIKPQTKLISVSYVQFLSGYRIDLAELGEACREKDIILSVDAIQAIPAVKLDLNETKADFISCGTQKWLLGLPGLAFVYISEGLQEKMHPAYVGWLSVKNSDRLLDYDLTLKKTASAFQSGTLNSLAVYALNSSLEILLQFGLERIYENVLNNTKYFSSELQKIGLDPVLKSYPSANSAGIITIEHPDSRKIFDELSAKDIVFSLREGMLRFSPHFYNIEEEINIFVYELKKLI
jgi:selenocysteine lyase/cysteine desulfurase